MSQKWKKEARNEGVGLVEGVPFHRRVGWAGPTMQGRGTVQVISLKKSQLLFNISYNGLTEVNIFYAALQIKGLWEFEYKCLVPIYVFPEMKLHCLVISKAEL